MNKRSVKKKRPIKPTRSTARKTVARKTAAHTTLARKTIVKSTPRRAPAAPPAEPATAIHIATATITVAQVTARSTILRTHKYRVGQTVFYTSSPISRPGASGSYKVVRLLPSDGDDYQYRIKNPGEAFERVAKESQLDVEH